MSNPLYFTGLTEHGEPLMGGLFRMKDQLGFPLDMAFEKCREMRVCPDWFEAMADAMSQSYTKYETVLYDMQMLLGEALTGELQQRFEEGLCVVWSGLGDKGFDSIQAAASRLVEIKRESGKALTGETKV